MSFLTQEAFNRADKERLGSFLTQEAFNRANAPGERLGKYEPCTKKGNRYICRGLDTEIRGRMGDLGCPCNPTMGDLGCAGCPGNCGSKMGDLGLDPNDPLAQLPQLQAATAQAAKVQAVISPWLWVFSIVGFGLALLNTSRVDKMWKRYGGSKFKGLAKPKF